MYTVKVTFNNGSVETFTVNEIIKEALVEALDAFPDTGYYQFVPIVNDGKHVTRLNLNQVTLISYEKAKKVLHD